MFSNVFHQCKGTDGQIITVTYEKAASARSTDAGNRMLQICNLPRANPLMSSQGRRHHGPVPTGLQADTGVDHAMHKKGVERSLFYLLEPSVLGIY